MTVRHFDSRAWLLVPAILLFTIVFSGCEDAYSAAIRYLVRTDPLVLSDKLGPERYHPDTPGQLPLMSAQELLDIPNPFFREEKEKDDLFKSGKLLDPTRLRASDRAALQAHLDKLFGTPTLPKVDGIDDEVRDKLKLAPAMLEKGSRYYRLHCLHCHGLTGNGRGPTSRWVNPHPRDYRQGLFKFQSVDQADGRTRKPRRADLMHTLQHGIEGTSMPSFGLLSDGDLESLVSFVIHLSIRGEAEFQTLATAFTFNRDKNVLEPGTDMPPAEFLQLITSKLGKDWLESQSKIIPVASYPYKDGDVTASVQRGQALFLADEDKLKAMFKPSAEDMNKLKAASCIACHKDYGRQVPFKFDVWGTLVRPANLTKGVYRGGRTPVDIYYRIHSGINGSGMANFGSNLTANQIWDLVNFVRTLPYPAMRDKYSVPIN